jgi:hypothetical protein
VVAPERVYVCSEQIFGGYRTHFRLAVATGLDMASTLGFGVPKQEIIKPLSVTVKLEGMR